MMLSLENSLKTIYQVGWIALVVSLIPPFIKNWEHSRAISEHHRCVIQNPKG